MITRVSRASHSVKKPTEKEKPFIGFWTFQNNLFVRCLEVFCWNWLSHDVFPRSELSFEQSDVTEGETAPYENYVMTPYVSNRMYVANSVLFGFCVIICQMRARLKLKLEISIICTPETRFRGKVQWF